MTKTLPKHPGGRPPLPPELKKKTGTFRRTDEQALKLEALGGGPWICAQIDAAAWPRGTKPKK